ncbi:MAG TPA: histone deacetylase [Gemmatimonadales bacterium]|nr:histone deacetylase [Gemmatimonadales bacterium]
MSKLPVSYHPATRLHNPGAGHPERPDRIVAVLDALRDPMLAAKIDARQAAPATVDQLLPVHTQTHIDRLIALDARGGGPIDADTFLAPRSWESVLASAGVALDAVTRGLEAGTAFGATRPPGHHALADRAMGFCFVNNVVVAARHAQSLGRKQVLIIDWDVHHGNGTQALVERDPSIRYVSMHQYPWYPGTGAAHERGVGNIFNVPRDPGLPRTTYVRDLLGAVDQACDRWIPDLWLISAGFDSLDGDPLGGFTLEPEDMAGWTVAFRERAGNAPVVALLEGGYRVDLLAQGVQAVVAALA